MQSPRHSASREVPGTSSINQTYTAQFNTVTGHLFVLSPFLFKGSGSVPVFSRDGAGSPEMPEFHNPPNLGLTTLLYMEPNV